MLDLTFTAQFWLGSVAMQLRWGDRFYSRYVYLSFLIVTAKECSHQSTEAKDNAKVSGTFEM